MTGLVENRDDACVRQAPPPPALQVLPGSEGISRLDHCAWLMRQGSADQIIEYLMPPSSCAGARGVQRWREDILLGAVVRALVELRMQGCVTLTPWTLRIHLQLPKLRELERNPRVSMPTRRDLHQYLASLHDPSCPMVISVGELGGFAMVRFAPGSPKHYHHAATLHGRVLSGIFQRTAEGGCALLEELDGFMEAQAPWLYERVREVLLRSVRVGGRVMSRREMVRTLLREGWRVVREADGGRSMRSPDGAGVLTEADLSAVGMHYAEHLSSRRSPADPDGGLTVGPEDKGRP